MDIDIGVVAIAIAICSLWMMLSAFSTLASAWCGVLKACG